MRTSAVRQPTAFPPIPSFDVKRKGNGDVIIKVTGAFAPNAQYFVKDLVTDERFEFLFQDARVVVQNGSWRFTARQAHVYIGHQFVCLGGDPQYPKNIVPCLDIDLNIDITVTPNP